MSKADEQLQEQETVVAVTGEETKTSKNDGVLENGNVRWMSPAYLKYTKYEVSDEMKKLGAEFAQLASVNQMPDFISKCLDAIETLKLNDDDIQALTDLEPHLFLGGKIDRKDWMERYKQTFNKRSNFFERLASSAVAPSSRNFTDGIDLSLIN